MDASGPHLDSDAQRSFSPGPALTGHPTPSISYLVALILLRIWQCRPLGIILSHCLGSHISGQVLPHPVWALPLWQGFPLTCNNLPHLIRPWHPYHVSSTWSCSPHFAYALTPQLGHLYASMTPLSNLFRIKTTVKLSLSSKGGCQRTA